MFYLMRKNKTKVGHTVWFPGRLGRLVYRVTESIPCRMHGSEVMLDYPGWRMKLERVKP